MRFLLFAILSFALSVPIQAVARSYDYSESAGAISAAGVAVETARALAAEAVLAGEIDAVGVATGTIQVSVDSLFAGGATTYVEITGDTMTGQLTIDGSTLTVGGPAFSVGVSSLVVLNGNVGISSATPGELFAVGDSLLTVKDCGSVHIGLISTCAFMLNVGTETFTGSQGRAYSPPRLAFDNVFDNAGLAGVNKFVFYNLNNSWVGGLGMSTNNMNWFVGPNGNYRFHTGTTHIDGTGAVEKVSILANGNVGIGDTAPSALLSLVTGNSGPITLDLVHGTSNPNHIVSINRGAEVDFFRILTAGNVGMGYNTPTHRLAVNGDGYFASSVTVAGGIFVDTITITSVHLYIDGDLLSISSVTAPIFIGNMTGNADTATAFAANGANAGSGFLCGGVDASGACELAVVDAAAVNASTSPVQSNYVYDINATLTGYINSTGAAVTALELELNATAQALTVHAALTQNGAHSGNQTLKTTDDVAFVGITASTITGTATGLRLEDDGNNLGVFVEDGGQVGIGFTNPAYKLDAIGTVRLSTSVLPTAGGLYVEDVTNMIGLGISNPTEVLHVDGNILLTGTITGARGYFGETVEVIKPADETDSQDTLQADDDLLFTGIPAGTTQHLHIEIYGLQGAHAAAEFDYALDFTNDAEFVLNCVEYGTGLVADHFLQKTDANERTVDTASGGDFFVACDGNAYFPTEGTFALLWSQNTDQAVDTTVLAKSHVEIHQEPEP